MSTHFCRTYPCLICHPGPLAAPTRWICNRCLHPVPHDCQDQAGCRCPVCHPVVVVASGPEVLRMDGQVPQEPGGVDEWVFALDGYHQPWWGIYGLSCRVCSWNRAVDTTLEVDGVTYCCPTAYALSRVQYFRAVEVAT